MGRLIVSDAPRRRADVAVVELDEEAVIYDASTGGLHHLNPSATIVWRLCDGEMTADGMATAIGAAFGMARENVLQQITDTIEMFGAAGLLES